MLHLAPFKQGPLWRKSLVRFVSNGKLKPTAENVPFHDDLSSNQSDLLEYFPNLEGFMNIDPPKRGNTVSETADLFDFSDIPMLNNDIGSFNGEIDFDRAYTLQEVKQLDIGGFDQVRGFQLHSFNRFKEILNKNDTNPIYKTFDIGSIVAQNGPLAFISKFNNPYLNLLFEYYIYDNMPASSGSSRLVLYKNKPCIVIGKNQNPFKEINLHYANITNTPILRRLSGGGTVVHDLGNWNFSFMAKKSHFDRTSFTNRFIQDLNSLIDQDLGVAIRKPAFPLGTIDKGDIINTVNNKKISGSAYRLSKGKFIHHGTMLIESQLSNLSKLLKLTQHRADSIVTNGTDSIPSPVQNYDVDEDLFLHQVVESYKTENECTSDNVFILNNYDDIPQEVFERAEKLKHWSWVFGKTPNFQQTLQHPNFNLVLKVEKFLLKSITLETEDTNISENFAKLQDALDQGEKIKYIGTEIGSHLEDLELSQWVSWEIDFNSNYANFGVDMNE